MTLLATVSSTTYTDTGLTNAQIYYYKVCAYSSAGNGMMTDTLASTPRNGSSTDLTIGMVIVAAIVDSINPCAISVMIFLLLFLTSLGNKRRVLLVGIAYIVTVFLVYFMAGLGLLTFLQSTAMTRYVYYAAAVLSIAIGLINIKDFIFPSNKPTVAIPESRKPMIKKYIEKASIPGAVVLGAMVSLFELPCTGGIYIAILSLLGDNMTAAQGIPYLALYNLIFVLPLAVILVIIYYGVSAEKANLWRLEKRSLLRLAIGLVMLLLGAMMLLGVF
jgi:cytochrome c biogenesis protein CcdA